jgi:hypothetical protein
MMLGFMVGMEVMVMLLGYAFVIVKFPVHELDEKQPCTNSNVLHAFPVDAVNMMYEHTLQ